MRKIVRRRLVHTRGTVVTGMKYQWQEGGEMNSRVCMETRRRRRGGERGGEGRVRGGTIPFLLSPPPPPYP